MVQCLNGRRGRLLAVAVAGAVLGLVVPAPASAAPVVRIATGGTIAVGGLTMAIAANCDTTMSNSPPSVSGYLGDGHGCEAELACFSSFIFGDIDLDWSSSPTTLRISNLEILVMNGCSAPATECLRQFDDPIILTGPGGVPPYTATTFTASSHPIGDYRVVDYLGSCDPAFLNVLCMVFGGAPSPCALNTTYTATSTIDITVDVTY